MTTDQDVTIELFGGRDVDILKSVFGDTMVDIPIFEISAVREFWKDGNPLEHFEEGANYAIIKLYVKVCIALRELGEAKKILEWIAQQIRIVYPDEEWRLTDLQRESFCMNKSRMKKKSNMWCFQMN